MIGPQLPDVPCRTCNATGWRTPRDRGDELRLRREALGLSLRALARLTGLHVNKLFRIESGQVQGTHRRRTAMERIRAALEEREGRP